MKSPTPLILGMLLLACNETPTKPPPVERSGFVMDHFGVTVHRDRVDFTIAYHFEKTGGNWDAFYMKVDRTLAYSPALFTNPSAEDAVQLFSSWFPLVRPLTPRDTVWASYRFTGYYIQGTDTTSTFDIIDSVRTVVQ